MSEPQAAISNYVLRRVGHLIAECKRDQRTLNEVKWIKHRGIGKKSLEQLRRIGVVTKINSPFDCCSRRIQNLLNAADIKTVEQAKNAILSGKIMKIRNFGKKCRSELMQALNIPQEEDGQ